MSVITNITLFWKEFEKSADSIRTDLKNENYVDLNRTIEYLDDLAIRYTGSHFFVELAYDEFECTFDTGPNKTSQYLAKLAVDMAPPSIQNGWILNSSLPPMSQKAIQASLKIKEKEYYLNDFHVFYEVNQKTQTIDCKLYCPGYKQIRNPERKKEMSMYLIELAVGQCTYEAYLSGVDYLDEPDHQMKFCNLIDAFETITDITEKKDWKRYQSPLEIYSVYQPNQDIVHDSLRKDMKLIFTTHPLLIEETIGGQTDVISDLEAKGGQFGYLYYLNPFHDQQDAVFRQKLSEQLDKEMSKYHIGKVIGGAIGKAYSYIDWIVFDEDAFKRACNTVKEQLNKKIELEYRNFND